MHIKSYVCNKTATCIIQQIKFLQYIYINTLMVNISYQHNHIMVQSVFVSICLFLILT